MYFSKQLKKKILKKIKNENYDVYVIKLRIGCASSDEACLEELVDAMFRAWNKMLKNKNKNCLKYYDGIVKRCLFSYSEKDGTFEPFFYLFCVRKRPVYDETENYKIQIINEKIRMQTYIKWFSAWATTLKTCLPMSVDFSLLELEKLEKVVDEFFVNEKYTLFSLIDETKKKILKKASGNGIHKLVSFNGIFKEMNRHLTVGR